MTTPCFIDLETQSACNLKEHGSYVYAEHPTTRVLCAAIIYNGHTIFWTCERYHVTMPDGVHYECGMPWMIELFQQPGIRMVAHNTDFERPLCVITMGLPEPEGGWGDTMDLTLMRGLPGSVDKAGTYLFGMGKDLAGYAHMMRYCKPNKAGILPAITDAVMQPYVLYNLQDTVVQYRIAERFGLEIKPEYEQWVNDLHRDINHRGVQLDIDFVNTLMSFDEFFKAEARREVEEVTLGTLKGTDLTRNAYLLQWFKVNGLELNNMRKESLEEVLEADEDGEVEIPEFILSVIKNRLVVSRAALGKAQAAVNRVCSDGRIRALFRYWGARTGRWASSGVQIHNLKRPDEDFDIVAAISAVVAKDRELFEKLCKGRPPYELLASLIRGIFIPKPGCVFIIGDYSAIEARGLLWMADDHDGLKDHVDADRGGKDIYIRFAEFIFKRTLTKKENPKERAGGKVGELACGYQGGPGAVSRMAATMKVDLAAANVSPKEIVDAWRSKHAPVVRMWHDTDNAFRASILDPSRIFYAGKCAFQSHGDRVEVTLPSARVLTYMNARLENSTRKGWEKSIVIAYDSAVKGRVKREELHGGKIVENVVQAFCRDLLADAMVRLDSYYDIVLHVHDEIGIEVPLDHAEEARRVMADIMSHGPDWALGLPLACKPSIESRYGK